MGLAVVYDRLLIAVEGQRTHLVGDLFRMTENRKERTEGIQKERRHKKEGKKRTKGDTVEEKKTLAMQILSKLINQELVPFKICSTVSPNVAAAFILE